MLTIHVWSKRLKEFLLTHPLYKSPQKSRREGAKRGLGGGKPFLATIVLIRRDKCRDSSREMKSFIATNGKIYRDESADLSRRITAIIAINRFAPRRGRF